MNCLLLLLNPVKHFWSRSHVSRPTSFLRPKLFLEGKSKKSAYTINVSHVQVPCKGKENVKQENTHKNERKG